MRASIDCAVVGLVVFVGLYVLSDSPIPSIAKVMAIVSATSIALIIVRLLRRGG